MKDDRKEQFLERLKEAGGIIYVACHNANINRSTFYRWRDTDPDFAEKVEEVMEAQVDFVESKLMELINAHDTAATIFYLKTKGKKRGWTEKQPPLVAISTEPQPETAQTTLPSPDEEGKQKVKVTNRIKSKKNYIVKLLKQQGKYTAELSMQVNITAQLLVRTEILAEEVLAEEHHAVNVEYSREGNERKTISPKEKLYLDFVQQSQKALRALGMNTDAKERKTDNDSFTEFLRDFSEGEGENDK